MYTRYGFLTEELCLDSLHKPQSYSAPGSINFIQFIAISFVYLLLLLTRLRICRSYPIRAFSTGCFSIEIQLLSDYTHLVLNSNSYSTWRPDPQSQWASAIFGMGMWNVSSASRREGTPVQLRRRPVAACAPYAWNPSAARSATGSGKQCAPPHPQFRYGKRGSSQRDHCWDHRRDPRRQFRHPGWRIGLMPLTRQLWCCGDGSASSYVNELKIN